MINIVLLTFECTFTAVKTVTQILLLFLYRVSSINVSLLRIFSIKTSYLSSLTGEVSTHIQR